LTCRRDQPKPWASRVIEAGPVSLGEFIRVADGSECRRKNHRRRFSTFLEHVKIQSPAGGARTTLQRAVSLGPGGHPRRGLTARAAGERIGRHQSSTHCLLDAREDRGIQERQTSWPLPTARTKILSADHKAAIDRNLQATGIPRLYTKFSGAVAARSSPPDSPTSRCARGATDG